MRIITHGLSKRFNREWIFKRFDFAFAPGRVHAITGPNGSGKSTMLAILCGHMPPSEGSIDYIDNDVPVPVDEIFSRISIAAPYMDLIEEFTLEEHVNFHFRLRAPREGLSADEVIARLDLENARRKFIQNFSSGMKQRLKLGLAFYTNCDILFLDEPSTNLDRSAFGWYLSELAKVPTSCLVIVASNNPSEYPENSQILNIMDFKS